MHSSLFETFHCYFSHVISHYVVSLIVFSTKQFEKRIQSLSIFKSYLKLNRSIPKLYRENFIRNRTHLVVIYIQLLLYVQKKENTTKNMRLRVSLMYFLMVVSRLLVIIILWPHWNVLITIPKKFSMTNNTATDILATNLNLLSLRYFSHTTKLPNIIHEEEKKREKWLLRRNYVRCCKTIGPDVRHILICIVHSTADIIQRQKLIKIQFSCSWWIYKTFPSSQLFSISILSNKRD